MRNNLAQVLNKLVLAIAICSVPSFCFSKTNQITCVPPGSIMDNAYIPRTLGPIYPTSFTIDSVYTPEMATFYIHFPEPWPLPMRWKRVAGVPIGPGTPINGNRTTRYLYQVESGYGTANPMPVALTYEQKISCPPFNGNTIWTSTLVTFR